MKVIVFDTSFLLTAIKFKIDIFNELRRICDFKFRLAIIDKTLDELKNKKEEKLILNLIKNINIIKTKKNKNVDNLILNLDKDYIIATQDKELKDKLKEQKKGIITIRQKKYLIKENVL